MSDVRRDIAVMVAGLLAWAGIFVASAQGKLGVSGLVSDSLLALVAGLVVHRAWRLYRRRGAEGMPEAPSAGRAPLAPYATPASFAPAHRSDRAFFLAFAALSWIAIVMGFSPEMGGHLKGLTPYPPLIVHVHVVVFGGWMVLFTAQMWLIRSRRVDLHRRLGLIAVPMVPIMVVLGVATSLVSRGMRFESGQNEMLAFMIVPLTDMVLFPSFAIPGLLLRADSALHKRLMLLAVATLLPAAFGRWIGPWILDHFGDGFFAFMAQSYLGPDAMILAAMVHDRLTRGRVHAVYWVAVPWMLAVQALTSAIYHWSGWMPLAQWMIGH